MVCNMWECCLPYFDGVWWNVFKSKEWWNLLFLFLNILKRGFAAETGLLSTQTKIKFISLCKRSKKLSMATYTLKRKLIQYVLISNYWIIVFSSYVKSSLNYNISIWVTRVLRTHSFTKFLLLIFSELNIIKETKQMLLLN